jgi:hypothetical protein
MSTQTIGKTETSPVGFVFYFEPELRVIKEKVPVEAEVCVSSISCPLCARPLCVDRWFYVTCEACGIRMPVA